MNKKRGFTIYEILIAIAIMVAASPFIYSAIRDLMQKRTAMEYVDYSNTYANKFIEYIESNYSEYYTNAQNNPTRTQVIPFSKIKNSMHGSLNWGVIPCVSIRYDSSSKEIQAIMFYTDNTKVDHRKISRQLGIKAMNEFGPGSAYYDNGVVNGINGTWALARSNPFMSLLTIISCDTSTLTANGLVINLNMLTNFPKGTQKSSTDVHYLNRVKDDAHLFGESNGNTMQTDIVMQNMESFHGIFFSGNQSSLAKDEQIFLGPVYSKNFDIVHKSKHKSDGVIYRKESSIGIAGGGLQVENLIPQKNIVALTPCPESHVGDILKEAVDETHDDANGGPYSSILICSKDIFSCNSNNGSYCFVPISRRSNAIRYTVNKASFTCPNGSYLETSSIETQMIIPSPQLYSNGTCLMNDKSIKQVSNACVASTTNNVGLKFSGGKLIGKYSKPSSVEVIPTQYTRSRINQKRDSNIISCSCDNVSISGGSVSGIILNATCSPSPMVRIEL
ncbi:MAG: type II secretion system protein [Burkholderiales bacterium]|nr:type II secretion system protein [Burkholderiales bacterium]